MDESGLKQRLENGECVYGPFVRTTDAVITEIIAYAGFDFMILDMEHGPMDVHQAENHVRSAKQAGCSPLVRVHDNDAPLITRALDTGAAGVQIPQINSVAAAKSAVESAKFFPLGCRGVCRFTRNAQYSNIPREEYFTKANENTLTVIQIEGIEGVQNIDSILEIQGYDVLFLGPYDLSQSLGIPGRVTDKLVLDTMESVAKKANARGVTVGSFSDDPVTMARHRDMGIQYLSYGIDTGLVFEHMRDCVQQIRRTE